MQIFSDAQAICAAPDSITDPDLTERVNQTIDAGLCDLTCIVVIEDGDSDDDLQREVGLSLLTNPLSGCRYGNPAFAPQWAWLQERGGWFEVIYPAGDEGFAYVIYIRNGCNELADLCRAFRE